MLVGTAQSLDWPAPDDLAKHVRRRGDDEEKEGSEAERKEAKSGVVMASSGLESRTGQTPREGRGVEAEGGEVGEGKARRGATTLPFLTMA